jgi:hypothetical protein
MNCGEGRRPGHFRRLTVKGLVGLPRNAREGFLEHVRVMIQEILPP